MNIVSSLVVLIALFTDPSPPAPVTPAPAVLAITGPAQVDPYKLVKLSLSKDEAGAAVIWDITPEEGVDILGDGAQNCVFTGLPGTYRAKVRVIRLGADGKTSIETARATVVIGTPAPVVPPTPADPLTANLQAVYSADTAAPADKAKHKAALAAVYRQGVTALADPKVVTSADLLAVLKTASSSVVPANALGGVRGVIGAELAGTFGTTTTPLDRAAATAALTRIASALEGLK